MKRTLSLKKNIPNPSPSSSKLIRRIGSIGPIKRGGKSEKESEEQESMNKEDELARKNEGIRKTDQCLKKIMRGFRKVIKDEFVAIHG